MKILTIAPAPWVLSGYGKQAGYWFPRFAADGHSVTHYAYRGLIGTTLSWPPSATPEASPITVLPTGRRSEFGLEQIPYFVEHYSPDVIISLHDLLLYDRIKQWIGHNRLNWYHWTPIDCSPLGGLDYNLLNATAINPIAISQFGRDQLQTDGFKDVPLVYHSVDPRRFYPPSTQERHQARSLLGIPDDVFVIGCNAANESSADRKSFNEQISAFASFHHRHPKSALYLYTLEYRHPLGLDIGSMLVRNDLDNCVIFPDPGRYDEGSITDRDLRNTFYWTLDLYTQCSRGEGFCIPVVEAQACGLPIVASNNSTFPEICARGDHGARLVPTQRAWSALSSSYWGTPLISDIEDAYEMFHLEWRNSDLQPYRDASRTKALEFSPLAIWEHQWKPLLDTIEKNLAGGERGSVD